MQDLRTQERRTPTMQPERTNPLANRPIWTLTHTQYLILQNVHQPHIAEISPMQYGMMSDRARGKYQEQRSREWSASGACKAEFDRLVFEAFKRGEFKRTDEGVSQDAKSAVIYLTAQENKAARDERIREARRENQILHVDDAEVGDKIFIFGYSTYATITKKLKVSFRVQVESGREYKIAAGACHWLKYDDMLKAVDEGRPINPRKIQETPDPEPPQPTTPAAATAQQREPETVCAASSGTLAFRATTTTHAASDAGVTTKRAEEIIREEMNKHGLIEAGWTFKFGRACKEFGSCNERRKQLNFSATIAALNTEDDFRECVRHEVAHAKAGNRAGHGRVWKMMALAVGANPQRVCGAHIKTPDNKYHATCDGCGHVHKMTRPPKSMMCCGICLKKDLHPYMSRTRKVELYNKYKLVWVEQATGRSGAIKSDFKQAEQVRTTAVQAAPVVPQVTEPQVWKVKPLSHASQQSLF